MSVDFGALGSNVFNGASAVKDKIMGVLDPKNARLSLAGLLPGGEKPAPIENSAPTAKFTEEGIDWRVKIKLADKADYFYKSKSPGLLEPLAKTNGVIFPYTPQISVTHTAKYNPQALTHSNYTNYSYEGSEIQAISITGDFTAQNNEEALYVLAVIQFFRAATKMWFGSASSHIGNPPPMVFLTGYGDNYFPNVPCVITSFQHTLPVDVDYIEASKTTYTTIVSKSPVLTKNSKPLEDKVSQSQAGGYAGITGKPGETAMSVAAAGANFATSTITSDTKTTMIPTNSSIVVTLQPIYSRQNVYTNFSLDAFAKGSLLGSKTSGGFI